MLPHLLPRRAPRAAILTLPAIALALGLSAPPVQALGKNEQKFLQGALAVLVIDALLDEGRKQPKDQRRQPRPEPVYDRPYDDRAYEDRSYEGRHEPGRRVYGSVYQTPAAQVFNSYGPKDRRRIQKQLAAHGYYRGGVDGSFGQGTYSAVAAWARDTGQTQALNNPEQMYGVYDSLLY